LNLLPLHLYTAQKKFDEAAEEYQQIIKLNPGNSSALTYLADLYVLQEKMTEEIACELMDTCELDDVMVVVEGRHMCEIIEGYWRDGPYITSSIKGRFFTNNALRNETLSLMGLSMR